MVKQNRMCLHSKVRYVVFIHVFFLICFFWQYFRYNMFTVMGGQHWWAIASTGSPPVIIVLLLLMCTWLINSLTLSLSASRVRAHTTALHPATDSNSNDDDADEQSTASTATTSTVSDRYAAAADKPADYCEVCLVAPRVALALIPCGHAHFC